MKPPDDDSLPPDEAAALLGRATGGQSANWATPSVAALTNAIPGYRVFELSGRGGMGAVFRAEQLSLERNVAIKVMPPAAAPTVIERERFLREARVLARLDHPHVLRPVDSGALADGTLYLVTEWAEGGDLRSRLAGGRMTPDEALVVLQQLASALDAAHAAGVVHRDLKPANVLLDARGAVKLGDFGVAALSQSDLDTRLTMTGTIMGSADYMAPEQFQPGTVITPAADVYALGVLAYEVLTGRLPKGAFLPPSRLAPVPTAVDAVVLRALSPEPTERTATAGAFVADLAYALTHRPPRWKRRAALTVLALLAGLAAGTWWQQTQRITPPESQPATFVSAPEPAAEPTPDLTPAPVPAAVVASEPTSVPVAESADVVRPQPPAPAVQPTPEPVATWRPLLPNADLAANRLDGTWTRRSDGNVVSGNTRAILRLAAPPGDRYEIRAAFTRLSGENSVALFLPTAAGMATVELDAWDQHLGGLQMVNGLDLRNNGLSFPATLVNGRRDTLIITVTPEAIAIVWNNRPQPTVSLANRRLSLLPLWETNTTPFLGIGSWESPTAFQAVDMR